MSKKENKKIDNNEENFSWTILITVLVGAIIFAFGLVAVITYFRDGNLKELRPIFENVSKIAPYLLTIVTLGFIVFIGKKIGLKKLKNSTIKLYNLLNKQSIKVKLSMLGIFILCIAGLIYLSGWQERKDREACQYALEEGSAYANPKLLSFERINDTSYKIKAQLQGNFGTWQNYGARCVILDDGSGAIRDFGVLNRNTENTERNSTFNRLSRSLGL